MDIGTASIVVSIIIGVAGIAITILILCSNHRRKTKESELIALRKELLIAYKDIEQLLSIETQLTESSGKSKKTVRKDYLLSNKCEPKRLKNRIKELENKIPSNGTI